MSDGERSLLRHFLGALAYRTQKALRDAPAHFDTFEPGGQVRSPRELVRHMTAVLGYARTFFLGDSYRAEPLSSLAAEERRFHEMLESLGELLASQAPLHGIAEAQLLQGPFADAMTHAGQLAMLRRFAGAPVAPENFVFAAISATRLGPDQAPPVSPDADWPERPMQPQRRG
jgi:hypothetical protein